MSYAQKYLADDIDNVLLLDSTGFVTQITQSWKTPVRRFLSSQYFTNGEWEYSYREGIFPDELGRDVYFDSNHHVTRIYYISSSKFERDMQFDANGTMTACTLLDGNTLLGSCL